MKYDKLLLYIMVIAVFLVLSNADPGDPLNPSQLGESMSMPLPQELIQDARNAGVITQSNPLYKLDREQPDFNVASSSEADAVNSIDSMNATGAWSFELKGDPSEQMKLYLIQNEDVIVGQGVIKRGSEMINATASGSISGDKLNLAVMPVGILDLYKLDLSLSNLAAGTYMVRLVDGSSRSGGVNFSVSSNIFKHASTVPGDRQGAYATTDSASATPVQLSGAVGLSRSISSTRSTSMSSSGGSMNQVSSSSTSSM